MEYNYLSTQNLNQPWNKIHSSIIFHLKENMKHIYNSEREKWTSILCAFCWLLYCGYFRCEHAALGIFIMYFI